MPVPLDTLSSFLPHVLRRLIKDKLENSLVLYLYIAILVRSRYGG
jgi:hypothetical protein